MKKVKITKEQFKRLSESTDVAGGINRVNKSFKKAFSGSGIKNLDEDQFNITKPVAGVPNSKMKTSKEVSSQTTISEGSLGPEVLQAVQQFIENVWLNPSQKGLDRVFIENGITWGDIMSYLTSVGVVAAVGGGLYKVTNYFKRVFSKDKEKSEIEKKADIEKIAKLVTNDPESPWQKKMKMQKKPESGWEAKPKSFIPPKQRGVDEDGVNPIKNNQMFKPIVNNDEIALFNGPNGMYLLYYDEYDKEYFPDRVEELSIEELTTFVNKNFERLPKGEGLAGWNSNAELIKVDDELKNLLIQLYGKNKNIVSALQSIQEMTSTASSGAFTTKLGITPNDNKAQNPSSQLTNEVIEEMDTTTGGDGQVSSSTGQYVQPAIWANGKKNWKAAKKTQYPKGEMVDFDSCTKLNNNKSAQSGKCSTGAVDNVVKTHGTKQSVISKTVYEQIAEKTGKTVDEIKKIIETNINKTDSLR